jgi:hypothetical protein
MVFLIEYENDRWVEKFLLDTSNAQRIVEKKLEMRKLWHPKVKGVKNSKKNH